MRIISDNSAKIEKVVTCKNCGVEIGYLPIDVKSQKVMDISGSTDTYKTTECPKCKETISVS